MMNNIVIKEAAGISDSVVLAALRQALESKALNKVLLIPPDFTRMHSGAGKITAMLYSLLKDRCEVDIIPALGTHEPMCESEWRAFFGDEVPMERMIEHRWRTDIVKIGEIPKAFVEEVSEGLVKNAIDVEVNKVLLDPSYDLVISIGQVVPHEVVGMANYSKNIFVGCGGCSMISQSHMLGAFYGMERVMGRDHSPVRKVFDYAERHFMQNVPLLYILTVTTQNGDGIDLHGLFIGRERTVFEEAVALSQEKNISFVDRAPKKVVVYLDEREFKSTWLGNKAIYRTRMAIAQGGALIVLAPGVKKFGEDDANDALIRKYGYAGRLEVLKLCESNADLQCNLSVAAHLIHGSSDGKFSITYAVDKLSREEVEQVNFNYAPLTEMLKRYDPKKLTDGWNTMADGEEIFYISNPALGLWADKNQFV